MAITRTTIGKLALLFAMVGALALAGCGGDDDGLSAEDMARIAAAETAATTAQAEADAAREAAAEAEAKAAADAMKAAEDQAKAVADAKAEAEAAAQAAEEARLAAEAKAAADAKAAEEAAAMKAAEVAAAEEAAAAAAAAAEKAEEDALAAILADLQEKVEELGATPMTPVEILGGTKSTASANDRVALAKMIAGQLNGRPANAGTMVNLPPVDGTYNDMLMDARATHAAGDGVKSADGTSTDKGFLRHSFTGGPTVDLTSLGDIDTLKLTNLLKVNGVDLKSFTLKETDKMMTQMTDGSGMVSDTDDDNTFSTTTTRGADGSMTSVTTNPATGMVVRSVTTSYIGGNRIVEYNPLEEATDGTPAADDDGAMITLADGRVKNYELTGAPLAFSDGTTEARPGGATPTNTLPAADLAVALRAYATAGAAYTTAQHNAMGYGAWLEDSFFAAYVISSEDDLVLNDPDSTAMKIAWGGRARDSAMAMNLSGRGETATWKGLMVGHDMDAEAATHGDMVKGNAMITARVGEATLADRSVASAPDVVDVSLTNIINDAGTAIARVADGIHWTNLNLTGGGFAKGSEIMGQFYDNGDEVVGEFNSEKILGVFGAVEYDMPAMMDDMASGN